MSRMACGIHEVCAVRRGIAGAASQRAARNNSSKPHRCHGYSRYEIPELWNMLLQENDFTADLWRLFESVSTCLKSHQRLLALCSSSTAETSSTRFTSLAMLARARSLVLWTTAVPFVVSLSSRPSRLVAPCRQIFGLSCMLLSYILGHF